MLAVKLNPEKHNVIGWLATEKIDGIRAMWNGRTMKTRNGVVIDLPHTLRRYLPRIPLDGELFMGRNNFMGTIRWLNQNDGPAQKLKYYVFDAPDSKTLYKDRAARVRAIVSRIRARHSGPIPLMAANPVKIKSVAHMNQLMQRILARGGEGLVVRDPDSKYVKKRSKKMLKLKPILSAIGTVVGHKPGKSTGSVKIEFPNGRITYVKGRRRPVGERVTVLFQELTIHGNPRHPRLR